MPPSKIPIKTRAAAIADLMSGEQPAVVAAKYSLDAGKVRMWKTRYVAPDVAESENRAVIVRPTIEAQQMDIGRLVLENLQAKLIATQRISEYVTTPEWLEKQNAADVAELFETIDRSSVTILDRMARGSRSSDAADTDTDAR